MTQPIDIGQQEINQPIVERAWLDLIAAPEEGTGLQRLTVMLTLNVDHKKELYSGYYKDGLVCHSHNLTWMFNSYKERIERLSRALDVQRKALQTIKQDMTLSDLDSWHCHAAYISDEALAEVDRILNG